jgi:hypothetical protein
MMIRRAIRRLGLTFPARGEKPPQARFARIAVCAILPHGRFVGLTMVRQTAAIERRLSQMRLGEVTERPIVQHWK